MVVRQSQESLGSQPRPQPAVSGPSTRHVMAAAGALMAAQLLCMGSLLARCYFRQGDFFDFDRSLAEGLTWKFLMTPSGGHFSPLALAASGVLARIALYNWQVASAVILALVAAADLAFLRMLRTLFGNRPAIFIPLLVCLFSALALADVGFWTAAVHTLPLQASTFMAIGAHVRHLRDGQMRHAVAAAGWLGAGLATQEKAALIPFLLFALTSGFFVQGRWPAAAALSLWRHRRAWLLYGALLAGYCLLLFTLPSGASTSLPSAGDVVSFAFTLIGTTLAPGVIGGPWRWGGLGGNFGQVAPPAGLQLLTQLLVVLIIAASCLYRLRAGRAWAILLGWIAADVAPAAIGGLSYAPTLLGVQAGYAVDAVPVFALCLGLACFPLAGQSGGYRFRLPPAVHRAGRPVTGALLAAFLLGSFGSFHTLESATNMAAERSYIATAERALTLAPANAVIIDRLVPQAIMESGFFGGAAYTSRVLGALVPSDPAQGLTWVKTPYGVVGKVMIFDDEGRLVPAVLAGAPSGPAPSRPARRSLRSPLPSRCWPVTEAGTGIPLRGSLYRWAWTIRVDYSGPAVPFAVRLGGAWGSALMPAGRHSFYEPLVGAGKTVTVRRLSRAPGQCLTGVTAGVWQPSPSGPAIPAAPVPG